MKSVLALCLFASVAFSYSTHFYGWQPHQELVFHYRSEVNSGIDNIRDEQQAGIKIVSKVLVQTNPDYSLIVKFEQPRYIVRNGERQEQHEQPIPQDYLRFLEQPFKVHHKRGVIEEFFVAQDEPVVVTNIKKSLLSNLNLDLTASRRSPLATNQIEIEQQQYQQPQKQWQQQQQEQQQQQQGQQSQSYFSVREQSLQGDCQTQYTVHPIPQAEAYELEQKWQQEEQKLKSEGQHICRGRQYYQIVKTKNFDNCLERPVYQRMAGLKSKCDNSQSSCKDLMNRVSATNVVICGELNNFVIRKTITENEVISNIAWNTEQKLRNKAVVYMDLIEKRTQYTPLQPVSNKKVIKDLIFEFPENNSYTSSQSLNQKLSESEKQSTMQKYGYKPVVPQPTLRSSPEQLLPVPSSKSEIIEQVSQKLLKVAQMIFESPQSCSSRGDVAGQISAMSKFLRQLSFEELEQFERKVQSLGQQQHQKIEKVLDELMYDLIAMVGTNPSVMLIKQQLSRRASQYSTLKVLKMVQMTLKSVRTPTTQLLQQLVQLVKDDLRQIRHQHTTPYTVALVELSNLLHKVCVNPESQMKDYPTRLYGPMCHKNSEIIVEQYIPFLIEQLQQEQKPQIRLVLITALGKTGHSKALKPLARIIQDPQESQLTRTVAVHSLKRVARMQPTLVKPVLMTLIDNVAELPEVRIAAIAVLPFAQPTTTELQKIAVRSWLEPSKEVASFIYSTFVSLQHSKIPELEVVGQKVVPLVKLVKPFKYGSQYSQNVYYTQFVKYLETAFSTKYSWTSVMNSTVPFYQSASYRAFGGAFEFNGLSYTMYLKGMDQWIDKYMFFINGKSQQSQQVRQQLNQIAEKLNIKQHHVEQPEMFLQTSAFDFEYNTYLNDFKLAETIEKLSNKLTQNPNLVENEHQFQYVHAYKGVEAEVITPTDAGFPLYIETSLPIVHAIKGSVQLQGNQNQQEMFIPQELVANIRSVANVKMVSTIGIVSPFTKQMIGGAVDISLHQTLPLDFKIRQQHQQQLTLTIKNPKQISNEFEVIHTFVEPFTYTKPLYSLEPLAKSEHKKVLLSGTPLKKTEIPVGQSLDLDAKIAFESDNKYTDLYSYYEKARQQSPSSLLTSFFLPSTLRYSSIKLTFNPQQTRAKEVSLSVSLSILGQQQQNDQQQYNRQEYNQQQQQQQYNQQQQYGQQQQSEFEYGQVNGITLIKEVCRDNFPGQQYKIDQCIVQLSAVEVVSEAAREVCAIHPFPQCQRLAQVCEEAQKICEVENRYKSEECQEKKHSCLNRVLSLKQVQNAMKELDNNGQTLGLRLDARSVSVSGVKNMHIGVAVGKQWVGQKQLKLVSNIEVKTSPSSPVYVLKFVSNTELPLVNNRWNKERLIQETLEMLLNGKIEYGTTENLKTISLEGKSYKTDEQKSAVLKSPEYKKCQGEEQIGKMLSPVCEKLRHEAASIDRLQGVLHLPESVIRSPYFLKAAEYVRSWFLAQTTEIYQPSSGSPSQLKFSVSFSHTGREAQIVTEMGSYKYIVKNIRLPSAFKGVFPISMRNPISYNVLQKFTRSQIPSSCTVEPQFVSTFDNKTYHYELNDCYHVLVQDRSQRLPISVLAKSYQGRSQEKEVKILSGVVDAHLKPLGGASGLQITLNINGRQQTVQVQPNSPQQFRENGKPVLKIERFQDNVYLLEFPQQSLWVLTNGQRIEVSAPQILKSRTVGLCGDLNGENTMDLKTPQKCQMSRPRFAAYSYIVKDQSCRQPIPSQDQAQYEREIQRCVREQYYPTSLMAVVQAAEQQQPQVSMHVVEKQKMPRRICLSIQKVLVKSEGSISTASGIRMQFVCFDGYSVTAKQLEQRALSGETLIDELAGRPIAFSKLVYQPINHEQNGRIFY